MATVTISDDQGQLMVTVDGGEPQPVQNAEDACQIVEATFGQQDQDDQSPTSPQGDPKQNPQAMDAAFSEGFKGIRGNGLGM